MSITAPGVYPDLDEAAYHADPVPETSLSVSGAKKILKCPARFKWDRDNPRTTKSFEFGKAAHSKILGTGAEVVAIPDELLAKNGAASTTAAKDFIAEAEAAGRIPRKAAEVAVVDAMAAMLATHPIAGPLFRANGQAEVSMFARDDATKVMLRGRVDWLTRLRSGRPVIVDYKTAESADPDRFAWAARDYDYHMQDRWYPEVALLSGLTNDEPAFLFVVQEKSPPYLVSVCELTDDARDVGAQRNRVARQVYLECMTCDEWPGYAPIVHPISLPYAKYAPEGAPA